MEKETFLTFRTRECNHFCIVNIKAYGMWDVTCQIDPLSH